MQTLGYYNGKFAEIDEMTIPMNDRVCFFGDGVYEATYARNHKIYCLDEHVDRFFNSAALLRFPLAMTKAEVKDQLNEMVQKLDSGDQFVYWQITRGTAPRNHAFPQEGKVNFWILLSPAETQPLDKRFRLITLEDTRFLHCNIKTLNLLPNVMAAQKTQEAGCDEAVLYRGETVTECAHSNVHILKDGILKTHPTDHYILPGIARGNLIKACKQAGVGVDETPFTLAELFTADEVIVSSSGTFCNGADELDGKKIGGKAPETLQTLQAILLKDFYTRTD